MPHAAQEASSSSSATLIQRLQAGDAQAWQRLVRVYGPEVYRWARLAGLQDSDAADLVQDVYRAVAVGVNGFSPDRPGTTFRAWLAGIFRHKLGDHFRKAARSPAADGGSAAHERLAQLAEEAPIDPDDPLTVRQRLAFRLLDALAGDFEPNTWQAFCRTTLESQATADVARELGMTEKAVRQARYRVLRSLRMEIDEVIE